MPSDNVSREAVKEIITDEMANTCHAIRAKIAALPAAREPSPLAVAVAIAEIDMLIGDCEKAHKADPLPSMAANIASLKKYRALLKREASPAPAEAAQRVEGGAAEVE